MQSTAAIEIEAAIPNQSFSALFMCTHTASRKSAESRSTAVPPALRRADELDDRHDRQGHPREKPDLEEGEARIAAVLEATSRLVDQAQLPDDHRRDEDDDCESCGPDSAIVDAIGRPLPVHTGFIPVGSRWFHLECAIGAGYSATQFCNRIRSPRERWLRDHAGTGRRRSQRALRPPRRLPHPARQGVLLQGDVHADPGSRRPDPRRPHAGRRCRRWCDFRMAPGPAITGLRPRRPRLRREL